MDADVFAGFMSALSRRSRVPGEGLHDALLLTEVGERGLKVNDRSAWAFVRAECAFPPGNCRVCRVRDTVLSACLLLQLSLTC